jgi:hypothetical protein
VRNVSDVNGNSPIIWLYLHGYIAEEKWVFRCVVFHVVTVYLLCYHPKLVALYPSRVSVGAAYRPVVAAQVYVIVHVKLSEASWRCIKEFSPKSRDLSVERLMFRAAAQPCARVCFMAVAEMYGKTAPSTDTDV